MRSDALSLHTLPFFLGSKWQQKWPLNFDLPKWQMHRGFHGQGLQENTMPALSAAQQAGAQMVEFDVRLAKDKIPVLAHDPNLLRIAGDPRFVADLLPGELQQVANISSLQEVLLNERIPSYLNIEIKAESFNCREVTWAVVQTLRRYGFKKKLIVSSFNPMVLSLFARWMPKVPRALLVSNEKHPDNHIFLRHLVLARLARPSILNCDEKMLTPDFLLKLRSLQVPVAAWTVNDYARAEELLAMGVVSIISDLLPPAYLLHHS